MSAICLENVANLSQLFETIERSIQKWLPSSTLLSNSHTSSHGRYQIFDQS